MSSLIPRKPIDGRNGQKRWTDSAQDKRVKNALKRQRTRRRDLSIHARQVATGQYETTTSSSTNGNNHTMDVDTEQQQLHSQQSSFNASFSTTTTTSKKQKKKNERRFIFLIFVARSFFLTSFVFFVFVDEPCKKHVGRLVVLHSYL